MFYADADASLSLVSIHDWFPVQGQVQQATARSDIVGPVAGADYTYRDSFDLVFTVTAPCGVSTVLNIVSDLRASNNANTRGSV
ncbi:hypothetical protein HYPSUDRAFT_69262 [Hypholoma sublateritium FD-334 SS-4]|uniref:Uncharacterized protein n=1 Tax=Hypholoma sublateritium (strain FD-334 SS-4) TaxID=945553 RepID=A0A0D2NKV4_HYPSF|nr:hypothetical protein HYPSUDRAFT_69262 [Hypholoma sublateritium FD-334 SS-4]